MFLNRDELSEIVGCEPGSAACMRRWLTKNGWPFAESRNGFPKVRRDYYDARMLGQVLPNAKSEPGPDKEALIKRFAKNDRSKKVA